MKNRKERVKSHFVVNTFFPVTSGFRILKVSTWKQKSFIFFYFHSFLLFSDCFFYFIFFITFPFWKLESLLRQRFFFGRCLPNTVWVGVYYCIASAIRPQNLKRRKRKKYSSRSNLRLEIFEMMLSVRQKNLNERTRAITSRSVCARFRCLITTFTTKYLTFNFAPRTHARTHARWTNHYTHTHKLQKKREESKGKEICRV